MKVTPKKIIYETAQCFGDLYGVSAVIELRPSQIWYVKKSYGYYLVHRKGGTKLRLTSAAFNRLFEVIEEGADDE